MSSIAANIRTWAEAQPGAPALLTPSGEPIRWSDLDRIVRGAGTVLERHGVGREDRVAWVLPNGPMAALTFLATASWTASAPLNPAYGAEELEFYLGDLRPRAIVLADRSPGAALSVAERMSIAIVTADELCEPAAGATKREPASDDDVALLLHTSGTTSRPKLVPLTQHNLMASARSIASTLALTPADRALNVMPLFHIHGLAGVLLSSVAAGGSVICLPRFDGDEYFAVLEALAPTWTSAVPTIHQAVLDAARRRPRPPSHRLRFIRSSSSSLPPQVMAALEETFGVPVVEAYGMTEASHQMACNPLPPRARKPGSVGLPAGPEITILDAEGSEVPRGARGEIAIRGASVTRGYADNAEANEKSFIRGWFRTGDEGSFDEEGYLFLTGRLKEMINRGGEKIAPVEIDRVMLDHPAVAQAVAFALPHPRLGEDVGVAVVLRDGASATAGDLRAFARARLAAFKVPSVVSIVEAIPKGATGKQQRIGLAEKLGVTGGPPQSPAPETPLQKRVAAVWGELLEAGDPRLGDDFFQCGGDSIVAVQLLARLQRTFGIELSVERFFSRPSLGELAEMAEEGLVERLAAMSDEEAAALLRDADA